MAGSPPRGAQNVPGMSPLGRVTGASPAASARAWLGHLLSAALCQGLCQAPGCRDFRSRCWTQRLSRPQLMGPGAAGPPRLLWPGGPDPSQGDVRTTHMRAQLASSPHLLARRVGQPEGLRAPKTHRGPPGALRGWWCRAIRTGPLGETETTALALSHPFP